jgi:hypothetical protein
MNDDRLRQHWERVYAQKPPGSVSWHRPHLVASMDFVRRTGLGPEARILHSTPAGATQQFLYARFRHRDPGPTG